MIFKRNSLKKKKKNKRDYYEYIRSKKWKDFRDQALTYYGHNCASCGNKSDLQVHHKHYKTLFREEIKDVMILCETCHRKTHKNKIWHNPKPSKYMRHANYETAPATFYPNRKSVK